MLLNQYVINYRKALLLKIADCRKQIHNLPSGRLECHHDGSRIKWYIVKNGNKKYLSKRESSLAHKLAYKRKLQADLNSLLNELAIINEFVKLSDTEIINVDHRLNRENEEVDRLASEYYLQQHPEISEWEGASYEHLEEWESSRKVRSRSGHYFASKDEAMIDNALHQHGLLVRYDEKLVLCNRIAYPDFHILDPKSGKDIYWEHFGMMSDYSYREKNIKKLKSYIESGYYPMINFITTFMGDPFRIDELWIDTIIDFFFEQSI